MKTQMTFERYELKYILSRPQLQVLLNAMEPHMRRDEFGHSSIRNLYLDTPDYRLIRRSLERPVYTIAVINTDGLFSDRDLAGTYDAEEAVTIQLNGDSAA